jgi:hypothetical protein
MWKSSVGHSNCSEEKVSSILTPTKARITPRPTLR